MSAMTILRFLFSPRLLFTFGATGFVCWTVSVWSSAGAIDHLLHDATREEVLNTVVWALAFLGLGCNRASLAAFTRPSKRWIPCALSLP